MTRNNLLYAFVDGAYLRHLARNGNRPLPNPRALVLNAVGRGTLNEWCTDPLRPSIVTIRRLTYYDARPEPSASENLESYWKFIESSPDCDLGFGSLRGRTRRQKGVDTLITVDMLVGAVDRVFDVAILVAGDADFVPVVQEVKRRGVMVGVIGEPQSTSDDLKRVADRFQPLEPINDDNVFPPLHRPGVGFWAAE